MKKRLTALSIILAATCFMPAASASAATATVTATVQIRQPDTGAVRAESTGGSGFDLLILFIIQAVILAGYGTQLTLVSVASWVRQYNPVSISFTA